MPSREVAQYHSHPLIELIVVTRTLAEEIPLTQTIHWIPTGELTVTISSHLVELLYMTAFNVLGFGLLRDMTLEFNMMLLTTLTICNTRGIQ